MNSIIFSSEMVRAILDGRKTQTRRVIKPQPSNSFMPEVGHYHPTRIDKKTGEYFPAPEVFGASDENEDYPCPYGQIGDRLWVKETFCIVTGNGDEANETDLVHYRADETKACQHISDCEGWTSPLFMPRKYSRITLEITDLRVERVQDISEKDAKAEGVQVPLVNIPQKGFKLGEPLGRYRDYFRSLWNSINAKRGYSWESNPFVWVIEFKPVKQPKENK